MVSANSIVPCSHVAIARVPAVKSIFPRRMTRKSRDIGLADTESTLFILHAAVEANLRR
jgi:hypothetical protein